MSEETYGIQPDPQKPDKGGQEGRDREKNPFSDIEHLPAYRESHQSDGGSQGGQGSALIGWVVFILIFGVGNLILYSTTGIFFIPIPRR
jgi:hypothetical protein